MIAHTCTYCGEQVDISLAGDDPKLIAELLLAHLRLACPEAPELSDLDPAVVARMSEAVASAELAGAQPSTSNYFDVADLVSMSGVVLQTHHERLCAGRPCCIHHPSAHHMRTWPQHWSQGHGVVLRRCPHDRLHPDPDDLKSRTGQLVHPCDGCCLTPTEI